MRLAIPCAVGIAPLMLEDAYANPGPASTLWWLRGPAYAFAAGTLSQVALWAGGSSLTLPFVIVFRGGAVGFVLTFTIRLLFQPPSRSRRGPI